MLLGKGFSLRGGVSPGAGVDEVASVFAASRPDVDEVICGSNHGFLVLHDNNGIAEVAETLHHADELTDVARM